MSSKFIALEDAIMKTICLLILIFISSFTCDAFGLTTPILSVSEEKNTSINLTWKDLSKDEDGYVVQLKTKIGYDDVVILPANTFSYNVPGLAPNTSYIYRVGVFKAPLGFQASNDISGHTTHTWGGNLFLCLEGATSAPPTRAELQAINTFTCRNKFLTEIDPVSDLKNLTYLDLNSNFITGLFPSWICDLTELTFLDLGGNDLTGSIPSEIGNLTSLQELILIWNKLTGPIPAEIGNLTSLQTLYLSGFTGRNQLTGSIPAEIGNLTSLEKLYLGNNQLTGPIPSEIGNLTSLQTLSFSGNDLTGFIPQEIGNLISLQELWLSGNELTGVIPAEIGNLVNLKMLYMDNNQLCGEIPSSLLNLTSLEGGQSINIVMNFLYTNDSDLDAFLVLKGQDWESSQGPWEELCPSPFSWDLFLPAIIGRH